MSLKQELESRLATYSGYLQQDPGNVQLILEVANLLNRLARFDEARTTIANGQELAPEDPRLTFAKATTAMASNNPAEAVELLQGLLDRGVDNGGVRYNLAYSHALLGHMEHAESVLADLAPEEAQSVPEVSLLFARVKHYMGDLESATAMAEQFVTKHPTHARTGEAEGILALLALDNEDFEAAKTHAEKAYATDHRNPESLLTLGSLALEEFNADEAMNYYNQAAKRQPESGRVWLGIGLTELFNQNLAGAEEALKKCVQYAPSHLGSWNTLAWCQIVANKVDDAEQTLQQAMDINHNFSETHGGLAVIALIRNRRQEAESHLRRALGLDKNSFSGKFAKSLLASTAGRTDSAQEILAKLMQTPIGKRQRTIEQSLQALAGKNQAPRKLH